MSKPIIEVEGLGKEYRLGANRDPYLTLREQLLERFNIGRSNEARESALFWALEDLSFRVQPGETLGIIGRNGAGKSTLLKVLSRITPPTRGKITMRGRVASLLEVGTGFHPELTGRENIYLNGAILGMHRAQIRSKFDEIVAFAEVERFLDTPVKRYSSGMYVRLAFAVAAHLEPEILIVDEVLAVGDLQFQKKCLGKMSEVSRGGRTVLFVSHNLTAIRTLCDRALLLRKGRLIADEAACDAVARYTADIRETVLERSWDNPENAPQNDDLVLKRVRVCDTRGQQIEELYTDTAFNIEIQFVVKRDGGHARLSIGFRDQENNGVLLTLSNQEPDWHGKPMPAGEYRSLCRFPANFFNNGWLHVNIGILDYGYKGGIYESDVLRLEFLDSEAIRGDYFGPYIGAIRPMLDWATTPT